MTLTSGFPWRATLVVVMLVFGCASAAAYGQDPFELFFGEGEIDAVDQPGPGQDDGLVLELKLHRLILSRDMPAFQVESGVCLPLAPFFEALEFPIEVDDEGARGWLSHPDQTLSIRFSDLSAARAGIEIQLPPNAVVFTRDGPCMTTDALSDLTGMPVTYNERGLGVEVAPAIVLPLEARIEREARRIRLLEREREDSGRPAAPDLPYRWISWPLADVDISVKAAPDGVHSELAFSLAGELMKATAQIRGSISDQELSGPVQVRFSRTHAGGDAAPWLPSTVFEIGDVSAPRYGLQMNAQTGRGVRVTNRALFRPEVFDETTIRGVLPPGWEGELRVNGELVSFVTEGDELGYYVFESVALQPGYNRIVVDLFGPFGETETREHPIFVGAELLPENEVIYEIGAVLPRRDAGSSSGLTRSDTASGPVAYASASYGISRALSLGARAVADLGSGRASMALTGYAALGDTYGGLEGVFSDTGGLGVQAMLQHRLSPVSSITLSHAQLMGLSNTAVGFGADRLTEIGSARFNTAFESPAGRLPVQLAASWNRRVDGRTTAGASVRTSGSARGVFWTHGVTASTAGSDIEGARTQVTGELLVSRAMGDGRWRAGINYAPSDGFKPTRIDLSYQAATRSGRVFQLGGGHDFTAGSDLRMALTDRIGPAQASASARLGDNGEWSVGIGLSFSLARSTARQHWRMGQPGLSRTGALQTFTFDDLDQDGVHDSDEPGLPGVEYILAGALRREASMNDGTTLYAGLEPHQPVSVELKRATLEDPFQRPALGVPTVSVRPGRIVELAVPVQTTGEIDGHVLVDSGDYDLPVSGVIVEAVNAAGEVVANARTEFDGYFYITDIPALPMTLRVSEESLGDAQAISDPVRLDLSRANPSAFGLRIAIFGREK